MLLREFLLRHPGPAMFHLRVWGLPAIRERARTVRTLLAAHGLEPGVADLLHDDLTCFTLAFVATEDLEEARVLADPRLERLEPGRTFRWTVGVHARGQVDVARRADLPWT